VRPGSYRSSLVNSVGASPLEPEDAELLTAMARGDASALGTLYDRHAPVLLSLAARILGAAVEAEDLVHEVFLEAWRHAAAYDPERASVKSWLILRTRSRCLDLRKSARVARRAPASSATLEELSDPRALAAILPDGARIRKVLLSLPREQQAVLMLGYFDGLSSTEIAIELAIPIGTVKSRTAAALAALRRALTPEGTR
jgi:RNA polymerase sigma-70 factor (ECF subfamily)